MIRSVTTVALLALAACLLYLPAAHPPEYFVAQIRAEHALHSGFWGEARATQTLARLLDLFSSLTQGSALGEQIGELGERLGSVPYVQSLKALLALMLYRFLAFAGALPLLGVFALAALFDGYIRRAVKSKEFLQHKADLMSVHSLLLVAVACVTLLALLLPFTVPPLLLALGPLAMGAFAGLALSNYHRRG